MSSRSSDVCGFDASTCSGRSRLAKAARAMMKERAATGVFPSAKRRVPKFFQNRFLKQNGEEAQARAHEQRGAAFAAAMLTAKCRTGPRITWRRVKGQFRALCGPARAMGSRGTKMLTLTASRPLLL